MIPAFVRGELVEGPPVAFAGFTAPDPMALLPRLPLGDPAAMADLHALSTAEVVDFLAEVGARLPASPVMAEALARLAEHSDLTPPVLRGAYEQLPAYFAPDAVREVAERSVGIAHLDGWVHHRGAAVRAFGARAVHVIAGNNPVIAAITLVRSAITRGDAIVKLPSNDPVTAVAIARVMAEVDPDHPLVRHLSAVYWKGGAEDFERALYRPANVEKIVAWGGFASVRHITRYLQPGLELIALDPKLSATVIGPEAFTDEETMRQVAELAAADVGLVNQEACFSARVIYAMTTPELAARWGELLHEAITKLPPDLSTPAKRFDPELRAELRALRTSPDWYRVIGGHDDEGAVVVSPPGEPVDFHESLSGRVANVVPIRDLDTAVRRMNAYTQTVGVWPDSLKTELRDIAALHGVQRLVALGCANDFRPELPQDAMEPVRRMVKWVVDETRTDVVALADDFDHHAFDPEQGIAVHREIRERGRVAHSRAHGGMWVLSRYDDVEAALKDHATFSSADGVFHPKPPRAPRFAPLEYDPPEHTAFRALMRPPFTPAASRALGERLTPLVRELITPIAERGHGDLVAELAVPLPLAVVGLAVGFSPDAQRRIRDLTANTWSKMPAGDTSFWAPFTELFHAEIRRAREHPGDDYLSTLVRAEVDGRPVTDDELHVMLVAYAIAGHETSMNTLSHLLRQLAERPDLQDRLRTTPTLIPSAVEETLRLWSPVDHGTRTTTRDVTIDGTTIPRGSRVVLLTGAANRDPRRFPHPDTFDLDRPTTRHLTFGQGIHFCLGAHLARLEFAAVLRELARHPNYHLTARPRRFYENGRHICLDRLPVTFMPR
ncbi:cytochrome P450 [Actinokineospora sp. NPDC004072]